MSDTIRQAITERHVLEVLYDSGVRSIEPHALGYSSEGALLLRAFQRSGASSSGDRRDWKLLRVDKIKRASPTGEKFVGVRPGYKRDDPAMARMVIQL